ncbi:Epidermal growth factor receptor substrate 15-like 1 [Orchesella cincta]|uniref:Epidermal growth factor receptor substrate 15-like 1 n=1 Tax=Orchesella cincta TaxID=48709 RepID=A0A1D2NJV3_ORCCI|nr:Epidermal growth factor receptor substrate 15-like 1 [Orchesella cincta]
MGDELVMYRKLFQGVVEPGQTHVPGVKAKGLMMESKLPFEILGKIWDLADTDRDGALDECEFIIALNLVKMAKSGQIIPPVLPTDAINSLRQRINGGSPQVRPPTVMSPPPVVMPLVPPPKPEVPVAPIVPLSKSVEPIVSAAPPVIPPSAPIQSQWIVTSDDRVKFSALFGQTDKDSDGFVSGIEIKDIFLQSGVPQPMLAHIWNLCDVQQQGKLTKDQFILAMFLIQRKVKQNLDPPQVMPPEMLMPPEQMAAHEALQETNAEFELIMREIAELSSEKQNLECEIYSKESDKKIKNGELKSLQSEYDTLAATLKQLENQKNVALNRLSELESQVNLLRDQAESQESTLIQQELELSQKATELQTLDIELVNVDKDQKDALNEMEKLTDVKQQTQLKISKLRTQLTDLQEIENTMKACLLKYDECIENGNVYSVTETELRDLGLEFYEIVEAVTETKTPLKSPEVTFQDQFTMDHQQHNDFFRDDDFTPQPTAFDSSPFEPTFEPTPSADNFESDPFAALRPESQPAWPINQPKLHDPFAPLAATPAKSPGGFDKDPFGADPFAGGGGGAAAPSLPPKKTSTSKTCAA